MTLSFKTTDNKSISLLLALSALILVLMLPLSNQVFSDDVAFSQSVRHFLQTGDLKISEYTAASSISHILWGSLFAKALGFSFSTLNLSVIILLPFLLISFYKTSRSLGVSKDKSLIFTLFFLSVPWIPFLTFTFMSDIPFLTLEILTIQFYLKFSREKNIRHLYLSLIFASLAFLMRQLGLALIFGAVVCSLLETKFSPKRIKGVILPLLIPIITLIFYYIWLSITGNKTIPQYVLEDQTRDALKNFLPLTNISLYSRVINLSLFMHRTLNYANHAMGSMFPLILVLLLSNISQLFKLIKGNYKIIFFSTIIAGILYLLDVTLFRKNYTAGFPLMVYEYESFLPIPWAHVWKFLVIFSIPFWSSILAKTLLKGTKQIGKKERYLLITFLGIFVMTMITFHSWDRYVIPLLPFAFIYLAKATYAFRLNNLIAVPVVAVLILDAVQMTKLRCTETGILYKIGNELVNQGVEPSTIDLNRDQNWDIWFYFEKGIQEQLKEVNGDKTKIENFQLFPLPKKNIKYAIYTDRMIKYQNLNIDYSKATIIPFKSLFVSAKLTFINY